MSEAIFVEGLTKSYNGKIVVDHLNISVKNGTVFGLLGANGAGKSTAIECMLDTKQSSVIASILYFPMLVFSGFPARHCRSRSCQGQCRGLSAFFRLHRGLQ